MTSRALQPRIRVFKWFRTLYMDRLTDRGRALFWVMVLMGIAANTSYMVKIYLLYCILIAFLLVSVALARLGRVPLVIRADLPERTTCGARVAVVVSITNKSRRDSVDTVIRPFGLSRHIRLSSGLSFSHMPAGEEQTLPMELEFQRRGHFEFHGMSQETLFPWGLWRDVCFHKDPRAILVYPRFHPLRSLDIPVGKRYQPGGIALSSNLGDSAEFISTREFRQGDSLRAIHWRSWARVGAPIVKEFQEEYFCRIALLLDTFIPERLSERYAPAFEAAISVSAAVADSLSREEYVIDLFAAGPEVYYFQAGRSLAHLDNVLDILACLGPCHEPPFEKITPLLLDHLERVTTTIVVLLDWDERRQDLIRMIRDCGCAVKAILVRDSPPALDPASGEDLTGPIVRISSQDEERGCEEL